MSTQILPKEMTALDMAFPVNVVRELLPAEDSIPAEFDGFNNPWVKVVSRWFFGGLPKGTKWVPKEGIDTTKALRHVAACLGSFEPSHEHKEAGCAYLLSLWFESVEFPKPPTPGGA